MQLLMMDMMVDMRGTSLAHQSARRARVFKASVYCLYHGEILPICNRALVNFGAIALTNAQQS